MWQTLKQGFEPFYDLKNFKKVTFVTELVMTEFEWIIFGAITALCIIMNFA